VFGQRKKRVVIIKTGIGVSWETKVISLMCKGTGIGKWSKDREKWKWKVFPWAFFHSKQVKKRKVDNLQNNSKNKPLQFTELQRLIIYGCGEGGINCVDP
jgi:hypothetical protein